MKYEKDYIINEIIRTAQENSGKPLGKQRFASETGINESAWYGVYWARWGDAIKEAGFEPNTFRLPYDTEFLLINLINLIREFGRFPTNPEILLKVRQDNTFPSVKAFRRLGKQNERIKKIIDYCRNKESMPDVIEICLPLLNSKNESIANEEISEITNFGFVYLMKSGKHYKIGRSNDADRRAYELKILMPEKLELIHKIKTDDPIGIEEYWHKRFKDKRKNGEWFELTRQEIEIFKRRKFM
ncbi:MAG: GIY-YIG nuclease family protein [Acidobacteria bacterium]|nr:GIY-YIG nuclease family protein [Acidobacteriota bacterium]